MSLGGDVRAYGDGHSASGHGWGIPVLSPGDASQVMFTREIHDGAIVTSTNGIRHWVHRGRRQHVGEIAQSEQRRPQLGVAGPRVQIGRRSVEAAVLDAQVSMGRVRVAGLPSSLDND